jgi:hypothetical protein
MATATPASVTLTFASVSSEDGSVREYNSSNTGGSVDTSGDIRIGDDSNASNRQYKGFLSFDTSSIPNGATITSVQLRLKRSDLGGNPYGNLGSVVVDVAPTSGFSGNYSLQLGDFQAIASAVNVTTLSQASNDGSWATGFFNAAGNTAINKSGQTQLRFYFTLPDDGHEDDDRLEFYSGSSGASDGPQLIITYVP